MKRLLIAAAFFLGLAAPALAACPSPITGKDASGVTQNFATINDGAGSCVGAVFAVDAGGVNKLSIDAGGEASVTDTTTHTSLSTLVSHSPALGQALAAASTPVVLTALQVTALTPPTSITANAGTNLNTSALALDSTLTGGTQQTKLTDGTHLGTIKAASTAAGATDTSLVTALSPNSPLPAGTNVLGHVICDSGCGGSGGTSSVFGSAFPTNGTAMGLTNGTNMVAWSATSNFGTSPGAIAVPAVEASSAQQGTWTVQPGNTPNTTPWLASINQGGNSAAVKAASTAPVATDPAVVATLSPNGNTVTIGNATILQPTLASAILVKGITAAMTGTTSTQVIAAVSSQHIYAMSVHCNNTGAAATLVNLQDGSGGTTLDTIICPAGGGDERSSGGTPLFWTTAGNALFAADVTTGQSVIVQASGFSSAN